MVILCGTKSSALREHPSGPFEALHDEYDLNEILKPYKSLESHVRHYEDIRKNDRKQLEQDLCIKLKISFYFAEFRRHL